MRDDVDVHQKSFRFKYSTRGVPIYPTVNFYDKIVIYLVILVGYLSFQQVSKYTTKGKSRESRNERIEMRVVGKIKILFILLLSNDLLYSTFRTLLHLNFESVKTSTQCLQAFTVALIMLISLTLDLSTIMVDNIFSQQLTLIGFYNQDERRQ